MGFLYIFGAVLFTIYGQLIIKWKVVAASAFPIHKNDKLIFFLRLFSNPWVINAFVCAFFASLCWMAALAKFELSYAYHFISLSFIFVLIFSYIFLMSHSTLQKLLVLS